MTDLQATRPHPSAGRRSALLLLVPLLLAALAWERIPTQDAPGYFDFADQRLLLGIPNIGDVLSNLPFILVGALGLQWSTRAGQLRRLVIALSLSCILTGLGSGYFHWTPNVQTLFWDRLPMVLLFSSLLGLLIADRVSVRSGEITAVALALLSSVHLALWKHQVMNLRPYLVLQFGAFLWIILFNSFVRRGRITPGYVWAVLGLYAVAKMFEVKDLATFQSLGFASGHNLKHLLAAAAVCCVFLPFKGPARGDDQHSR